MAFGDSFDIGAFAAQIGISEGRKRRQQQKEERRQERTLAQDTAGSAEDERAAKRRRLGLVRTQFGANVQARTGKLGEPLTGRRRLTV